MPTSRYRSAAALVVALTVTFLSAVLTPVSSADAYPRPSIGSSLTDQCPETTQLPQQAGYPVSGVFMYFGLPCETRQKFEEFKSLGGDTIATFGPALSQRDVSSDGQILDKSGAVDPKFVNCVADGLTCRERAEAVVGAERIRRTMVYGSDDIFGAEMARCTANQLDEVIMNNDQRYLRLLLPVGHEDGASCDENAEQYDLIVTVANYAEEVDKVDFALSEADRLGISVYRGLPSIPGDPQTSWLPDTRFLDTLKPFASRFLDHYENIRGQHSSLVGMYQNHEIPLKGNAAWNKSYTLYETHNELLAERMPGAKMLFSPYLSARTTSTGLTLEDVKAGMIRLASIRHGVEIVVAPQDGRGTGKGSIHFPDEIDETVLPSLQSVVGGPLTYGEAYRANTAEYFAAMESTLGELTGIELWANLEAMEPAQQDGETDCDIPNPKGRGLATKERLDQQIAMVGQHVSKIISFMWDPFFYCEVLGDPSLSDQIYERGSEPIVAGASGALNGTISGLDIVGFNLVRAQVTISYLDINGDEVTVTYTVPSQGKAWPGFGRRSVGQMEALQKIWVPFETSTVHEDNRLIKISVHNHHGSQSFGTYRTVLDD